MEFIQRKRNMFPNRNWLHMPHRECFLHSEPTHGATCYSDSECDGKAGMYCKYYSYSSTSSYSSDYGMCECPDGTIFDYNNNNTCVPGNIQ